MPEATVLGHVSILGGCANNRGVGVEMRHPCEKHQKCAPKCQKHSCVCVIQWPGGVLNVGEPRFNDKLCCWIIDVNGSQEFKALLTSFGISQMNLKCLPF